MAKPFRQKKVSSRAEKSFDRKRKDIVENNSEELNPSQSGESNDLASIGNIENVVEQDDIMREIDPEVRKAKEDALEKIKDILVYLKDEEKNNEIKKSIEEISSQGFKEDIIARKLENVLKRLEDLILKANNVKSRIEFTANETKDDVEVKERKKELAFEKFTEAIKILRESTIVSRPNREWVLQSLDSALSRIKTSKDKDFQTEVRSGLNNQKEGVPVDGLIYELTLLSKSKNKELEEAIRNNLSDEEKDKVNQEIATLYSLLKFFQENSQLYFEAHPEMAGEENGDKQNWRTEYEANLISNDFRKTGNSEEDYKKAMQEMSKRREFVLEAVEDQVETTKALGYKKSKKEENNPKGQFKEQESEIIDAEIIEPEVDLRKIKTRAEIKERFPDATKEELEEKFKQAEAADAEVVKKGLSDQVDKVIGLLYADKKSEEVKAFIKELSEKLNLNPEQIEEAIKVQEKWITETAKDQARAQAGSGKLAMGVNIGKALAKGAVYSAIVGAATFFGGIAGTAGGVLVTRGADYLLNKKAENSKKVKEAKEKIKEDKDGLIAGLAAQLAISQQKKLGVGMFNGKEIDFSKISQETLRNLTGYRIEKEQADQIALSLKALDVLDKNNQKEEEKLLGDQKGSSWKKTLSKVLFGGKSAGDKFASSMAYSSAGMMIRQIPVLRPVLLAMGGARAGWGVGEMMFKSKEVKITADALTDSNLKIARVQLYDQNFREKDSEGYFLLKEAVDKKELELVKKADEANARIAEANRDLTNGLRNKAEISKNLRNKKIIAAVVGASLFTIGGEAVARTIGDHQKTEVGQKSSGSTVEKPVLGKNQGVIEAVKKPEVSSPVVDKEIPAPLPGEAHEISQKEIEDALKATQPLFVDKDVEIIPSNLGTDDAVEKIVFNFNEGSKKFSSLDQTLRTIVMQQYESSDKANFTALDASKVENMVANLKEDILNHSKGYAGIKAEELEGLIKIDGKGLTINNYDDFHDKIYEKLLKHANEKITENRAVEGEIDAPGFLQDKKIYEDLIAERHLKDVPAVEDLQNNSIVQKVTERLHQEVEQSSLAVDNRNALELPKLPTEISANDLKMDKNHLAGEWLPIEEAEGMSSLRLDQLEGGEIKTGHYIDAIYARDNHDQQVHTVEFYSGNTKIDEFKADFLKTQGIDINNKEKLVNFVNNYVSHREKDISSSLDSIRTDLKMNQEQFDRIFPGLVKSAEKTNLISLYEVGSIRAGGKRIEMILNAVGGNWDALRDGVDFSPKKMSLVYDLIEKGGNGLTIPRALEVIKHLNGWQSEQQFDLAKAIVSDSLVQESKIKIAAKEALVGIFGRDFGQTSKIEVVVKDSVVSFSDPYNGKPNFGVIDSIHNLIIIGNRRFNISQIGEAVTLMKKANMSTDEYMKIRP